MRAYIAALFLASTIACSTYRVSGVNDIDLDNTLKSINGQARVSIDTHGLRYTGYCQTCTMAVDVSAWSCSDRVCDKYSMALDVYVIGVCEKQTRALLKHNCVFEQKHAITVINSVSLKQNDRIVTLERLD